MCIYIYIYIYIYIIAYLFRDCCFPGSKHSPNITVHHSYSHLAHRYTSIALQIPDVASSRSKTKMSKLTHGRVE